MSYKDLENQYVVMCAYYEAEIEKLKKQLKQQRDPDNLEQTLRNEIAAAVADKMDYMHCCENERETYLRIIRDDCKPFESHCDKDCTNTNCESHPDYMKGN